MNWYLIVRNDDIQIICVMPGSDPLYGYGSWNLADGPFASFEDAQSELNEMLEPIPNESLSAAERNRGLR